MSATIMPRASASVAGSRATQRRRPAGNALLGLGLAAIALLMIPSIGRAASGGDMPVDERARQIAQELRCPICEGLSVADSPSQLAVQMRGVIREKLESGESRDEIVRYFVQRYGESILMEPPRRGFTTVAWVAPYLALLATLAFLGWKLRRKPTPASPPVPDDDLAPYLETVDETYELIHDEAIR
ncbi:MAG TPA: cytochrome c-type biogenesis protein CcmH [Chloroflexota bacterium]|nr:cytochrome c-type biogenesis protein CcmH [Chloroflexota bacterium]